MSVTVHHGDSREVLKGIADASMDACVTDPPYALVSIGKRFGADNAAPAKSGKSGVYARASSGFMGQKWDTGETAFDPEFWREVYRVLKPGAHVVAFAGTRTYHLLASAIEDAGFEIRDMLSWLYGSGFPKSHDVSKGIDRAAGAEREVVSTRKLTGKARVLKGGNYEGEYDGHELTEEFAITAPATDAAREWEGWGTALKPACEPIVLARKPLIGTVAANVLQHGTGALNIDATRVGYASDADKAAAAAAAAEQRSRQTAGRSYEGWGMEQQRLSAADYMQGAANKGRWPANVVHDGSEEVTALFPQSDGQQAAVTDREPSNAFGGTVRYGNNDIDGVRNVALPRNDDGSAARFFYTAKADANDRLGSKHPTVKPISLMRWLVRLVTPPNGYVLDPFAGTGTTGIAAKAEGFNAILIEREESFAADIRIRLDHADGKGPLTSSLKARNKPKRDMNEGLFA